MKMVIVIWSMLAFLLPATYGFAQMGGMIEQKGEMKQQGMMDEGMMKQTMPMMQMCMPMMKQMMGQSMMMGDMMQTMMDMMKAQKRMMHGMKPAEKEEMMMDMDKMMERMEKMMSEMRGMMMHGMTGPAPMEPQKEEQKKEAPTKGETPKTDPHKH